MPNYPEGRCRVLLATDEAIQALALQYELEDAGYRVAGPFATCAEAMAWLTIETPDVAVLDTVLKDGSCKDLAAELTRRGVPFVINSGLQQAMNSTSEFMEGIWVEKPAAFGTLLDALISLQRAPTLCRISEGSARAASS
ncbi:response regulator [Microvirga massiliensis]|uniref:response regulator n=1 Tax=Microvirga massiliensis TaxID=1033741 RepID=UPI00065F7A03|nr:response regulator [Microvirga massiliensis]